MSTNSAVSVVFEQTPNPQSLKFKLNLSISEGVSEFENSTSAQRSPLASKIFGFPWTESVLIGQDFITITKQDWVDWETLATPLADLIAEHIRRGEAILVDPVEAYNPEDEDDSDPVVAKIKSVLYNEVRPAVAMDGGDITFHSYVDQIVYVYMRGACSGCPSSSYTLKMGIETRLKEAVPEIREVIAL